MLSSLMLNPGSYGILSFYLRSPLLSMREAVLTVSPNRQYRGIFNPTTPAQTGPKEGNLLNEVSNNESPTRGFPITHLSEFLSSS